VKVVSFCHSCASITNPLSLYNSTMFFEVTWPSSSEFWSNLLIGYFNLCKPHALSIQCIFIGSSIVSSIEPLQRWCFSLSRSSFKFLTNVNPLHILYFGTLVGLMVEIYLFSSISLQYTFRLSVVNLYRNLLNLHRVIITWGFGCIPY